MKEIDYTKMRKGTRTGVVRKIEICPKCGRKGEITRFKDGDISVAHKAINHDWCHETTDGCFIKRARTIQEGSNRGQ